MRIFARNPQAALKLSTALLLGAAVSACTVAVTPPVTSPATPRVGPTAGASSTWAPRSYEQVTSTAAVTSRLGGSEILRHGISASGALVNGSSGLSIARISGALTHNTGTFILDDGTYLFVAANTPGLTYGILKDGHGAIEIMFPPTSNSGPYKYVNKGYLNYKDQGNAAQSYFNLVYSGIVTAAADMPISGSASYSGNAEYYMQTYDGSTLASDTNLKKGTSAVNVDFGAGTASVDMHSFTTIHDGNGVVLNATTTPLDEVKGTGLTISGTHITGGTWVTMKGGHVVNLLGASPVATSDGTFYGYAPTTSAPAEVAGVVLIKGATQAGVGSYAAK